MTRSSFRALPFAGSSDEPRRIARQHEGCIKGPWAVRKDRGARPSDLADAGLRLHLVSPVKRGEDGAQCVFLDFGHGLGRGALEP